MSSLIVEECLHGRNTTHGVTSSAAPSASFIIHASDAGANSNTSNILGLFHILCLSLHYVSPGESTFFFRLSVLLVLSVQALCDLDCFSIEKAL